MNKQLLQQLYDSAVSHCDQQAAWLFEEELMKAMLLEVANFAEFYQGPQQDLDLFVYELKNHFGVTT